ncbi:MAG TPA: hypothetical protein VM915_14335 [Verrucomicrobiae bacterium]|jgi:hypothetical protein|nr:hypothetical protein [Verrucomicrobiae bacterium]
MIKVFVVLAPNAAMRLAGASPQDVAAAQLRILALARRATLEVPAKFWLAYVDEPPPEVDEGWSARVPVNLKGLGPAELRIVGDMFDPD